MEEITNDILDLYECLCTFLLEKCSPSMWALANRLINLPALGDQKPSTLMDKILSLLPLGETPSVLFQTIFLNRLPEHIKDHLASKDFPDVRTMLAHADRFRATHQSDATAAGIATLQLSGQSTRLLAAANNPAAQPPCRFHPPIL